MVLVVVFVALWLHLVSSLEPYDLPVVPPALRSLVTSSDFQKKVQQATDGKYIPRKAWIAVRNVSDEKPGHMLGDNGFIRRNSNWEINFCDNAAKDGFMKTNFDGSSIFWAYDILNPNIGTAKAEIWRLAILYLHGGEFKHLTPHCTITASPVSIFQRYVHGRRREHSNKAGRRDTSN
jgi:hypothetical protein